MTGSSNGDSPDSTDGLERPYTPDVVERLRGPVKIEHTLARLGAERLRKLLGQATSTSRALGAMTGGQAVQMAKAGLEAIYLSGWQVAADANVAGQTYPDQSLYPADSAPALVRRLNARSCARCRSRLSKGARRTGSCRSSPTPRPASAGRCRRTS